MSSERTLSVFFGLKNLAIFSLEETKKSLHLSKAIQLCWLNSSHILNFFSKSFFIYLDRKKKNFFFQNIIFFQNYTELVCFKTKKMYMCFFQWPSLCGQLVSVSPSVSNSQMSGHCEYSRSMSNPHTHTCVHFPYPCGHFV